MAKTIRKRPESKSRAPGLRLIIPVMLGVVLIGGAAYAWFSWLRPTPPLEEAEEAMREILAASRANDGAKIKPLLTKRSQGLAGSQTESAMRTVGAYSTENWAKAFCPGVRPGSGIHLEVSVGKASRHGREAWVPVTAAYEGRGRSSTGTVHFIFVCERSQWRLDLQRNAEASRAKSRETMRNRRGAADD